MRNPELPVRTMRDLESIGPRMKWQYFEMLVGFVFEQNGYDVTVGAVRKGSWGRRQYDVLAESQRHLFAADCKRWTGRRYRESQLRSAAAKQAERCMLLKSETDKGIIPLIVTLLPEGMVIHDGVPIVPFEDLNSFLNSWEGYDEDITEI
ncbi:MAG: hypothetical protein JXC85_05795 [Candidatus Aenigmarchaeota archaeon]|nr:hypothetical protein [Candidatus Aenigmarchaeota archaeon]